MSDSLEVWLERIGEIGPAGWDLGLDRVGRVGAALDLLHPAGRVVLVAGTNGKGSTCEYLTQMALASGLKTGTSTSPHLFRFNERICIDGVAVDDQIIISAFSRIDAARGEITLTYFEFAALASLLIFKEQRVDIAILEVGLGGRLDAMNIVQPDLCVITSISLDHQSWLGDSREVIAREKAGIMREGITCLVTDRQPPPSLSQAAATCHAPLEFIGTDFDRDPAIECALSADSFAAAQQAAMHLGFEINTETLANIARESRLSGRRTWLHRQCRVLLDVAHNPAAAEDFADYVRGLDVTGDIHAVVGIYGDKDIEGVLVPLKPLVKTWHLTDMDDPRASPAAEIQRHLAEDRTGQTFTYAKISDAAQALESQVRSEDLMLIVGSFPVVAGALDYFGEISERT